MHHQKKILGLAVWAACGGYASNGVAQTTGGNNRDIEELLVFGTQGARESATGSRLDLTLLETPATVDIIDGEAIRARMDTSVLEAVTRSAGFTNESNPGNGNSSIAARGFDGQGSVTKLYDGTHYYTAASTITFPFDTWGVERIEVLKGPSSVLYGEGGIGGAINIIPRRPQREPQRRRARDHRGRTARRSSGSTTRQVLATRRRFASTTATANPTTGCATARARRRCWRWR